jgi:hypothetical protein
VDAASGLEIGQGFGVGCQRTGVLTRHAKIFGGGFRPEVGNGGDWPRAPVSWWERAPSSNASPAGEVAAAGQAGIFETSASPWLKS